MNVVVICGRLSGVPVVRTLASGGLLLSLELTTATENGAASVPVAWFDPPEIPLWEAGEELMVSGTVKRRFFRTSAGTQTRTEVVAERVVQIGKRRQVNQLLARSVAALGAPPTA
jgi:hypothetical protein